MAAEPGVPDEGEASELEVTIQRVVAGGVGIAFAAGRTLFVPYTAPGERVRVAPPSGVRRSGRAAVRAILEPGEGRVDPPCGVHGRCGGCQLGHLNPDTVARVQREVVADALRRLGRLEGIPAVGWVGAEQRLGYRCRAGFKVRWVGGEPLVGFFATASHRVVDLPGCPVLEPRLSHLLPPLRQLVARLPAGRRLPQVDVSCGEEGVGMVVHLLAPPGRRDRELLIAFARERGIAQLGTQVGRKSGLVPLVDEGELLYRVGGWELAFPPGGFVQAHLGQNRLLVATVLEMAGEGSRVVELFCGVGNFTLPLAARFARVVGVEGYRPALARGERNARRNGIGNVEWRERDLTAGVPAEWWEGAEVVVLDPPREGAVVVVKDLAAAGRGVQRVVYVSCDPATFARDAAILVGAGGFVLERVTAVEMFPQTAHVEVVGLFRRGDGTPFPAPPLPDGGGPP